MGYLILEIINLFPIPVFKYKIVPTEEQCTELMAVLNNVFSTATEQVWASETGKSTGQYDLFLHDNPSMQWLVNSALHHACDAWLKLDYAHGATLSCFTSWANLHKPGQVTGEHSHCTGSTKSHISCVYYLKKPVNSGHIEFRDPLEYIHSLTPSDMFNPEANLKSHTAVEADEFDLVVFPSWLNHRSQVNKSQDDRIAISINFIGHWILK